MFNGFNFSFKELELKNQEFSWFCLILYQYFTVTKLSAFSLAEDMLHLFPMECSILHTCPIHNSWQRPCFLCSIQYKKSKEMAFRNLPISEIWIPWILLLRAIVFYWFFKIEFLDDFLLWISITYTFLANSLRYNTPFLLNQYIETHTLTHTFFI